jgi:hypothetical protein
MPEIQKVSPVLTVIEDGGEYVIQASTAIGKRLGAIILAQIPNAPRVTFVDETGVKVFKNTAQKGTSPVSIPVQTLHASAEKEVPSPDFPSPKPIPASQRIFQDNAAPPAPELVEEEYEAVLKQEAADAAELARQEQFNRQSAVPPEPEAEKEDQPTPRKREPRDLQTNAAQCGRCEGSGQIVNDGGFSGPCPVCKGKGVMQAWGRGRQSHRTDTDSLHARAR